MFCKNCGNQLNKEEKFCSYCGTRVREEPIEEGIKDGQPKEQVEEEKALIGNAPKEVHKEANKHTADEADKPESEESIIWNKIKDSILGKHKEIFVNVSSPIPKDANLSRFDIVYVVLIALVVLYCLINGGWEDIIGRCLIFVPLGWVVKTVVAAYKWDEFEWMRYKVVSKKPIDELILHLTPLLVPYGMFVECYNDMVRVTCGKYQYDISYQDESCFMIIPKRPLLKRILSIKGITDYRNSALDLGILSYYITCISNGTGETGTSPNTIAFAANYKKARGMSKKKHLIGILVGAACIIMLMASGGMFTPNYNEEVQSVILYGTECTVQDAFEDFFGDLEWETSPSNTDGLYLVDATGKCYHVYDKQAKLIDCKVEFVYKPESGSVYIQQIQAGEQRYSDDGGIWSFLEDVYGYENMTTPNTIGGLFEGLGNSIVSGVNNYLFGHYVSYQEGRQYIKGGSV